MQIVDSQLEVVHVVPEAVGLSFQDLILLLLPLQLGSDYGLLKIIEQAIAMRGQLDSKAHQQIDGGTFRLGQPVVQALFPSCGRKQFQNSPDKKAYLIYS